MWPLRERALQKLEPRWGLLGPCKGHNNGCRARPSVDVTVHSLPSYGAFHHQPTTGLRMASTMGTPLRRVSRCVSMQSSRLDQLHASHASTQAQVKGHEHLTMACTGRSRGRAVLVDISIWCKQIKQELLKLMVSHQQRGQSPKRAGAGTTHRSTERTFISLHAVCTALSTAGLTRVYTTRASSRAAVSTIL